MHPKTQRKNEQRYRHPLTGQWLYKPVGEPLTQENLLIAIAQLTIVGTAPDNCYMWRGKLNKYKRPIISINGEYRSVARVLHEINSGGKLDPDFRVIKTCLYESCANFCHYELRHSTAERKDLHKSTCLRGHVIERAKSGHRRCRECCKLNAEYSAITRKETKRSIHLSRNVFFDLPEFIKTCSRLNADPRKVLPQLIEDYLDCD